MPTSNEPQDPRPPLVEAQELWAEIATHPAYRKLDPETQSLIKQKFYKINIAGNPAIRDYMQAEPEFGVAVQHGFFAPEIVAQSKLDAETAQRSERVTAQPLLPELVHAVGGKTSTDLDPGVLRGAYHVAESLTSTENLALLYGMRFVPAVGTGMLAKLGMSAPAAARATRLGLAGVDAYFATEMGRGVYQQGQQALELNKAIDEADKVGNKALAEQLRGELHQALTEGALSAGLTFLASRGALRNTRSGITGMPTVEEAADLKKRGLNPEDFRNKLHLIPNVLAATPELKSGFRAKGETPPDEEAPPVPVRKGPPRGPKGQFQKKAAAEPPVEAPPTTEAEAVDRLAKGPTAPPPVVPSVPVSAVGKPAVSNASLLTRSIPDFFKQKISDKSLSPGGEWTEETLRKDFDIPKQMSLGFLAQQGAIERTPQGTWRLQSDLIRDIPKPPPREGPEIIPPSAPTPADTEDLKDQQFLQARQNFKQATKESKSLSWAVSHGQGNAESVKRLDVLERRKDQALLEAVQSQPPEAAKQTLTSLLTVGQDLQMRGQKLKKIANDLFMNRRIFRQGQMNLPEGTEARRVQLPEIEKLLGKAFRRAPLTEETVAKINKLIQEKAPEFQPLDIKKRPDRNQLNSLASAMALHAEGRALVEKGERFSRTVEAGAKFHKIPLETIRPRVEIPETVTKAPVPEAKPVETQPTQVVGQPAPGPVKTIASKGVFTSRAAAETAGEAVYGKGNYLVIPRTTIGNKQEFRVEGKRAPIAKAPVSAIVAPKVPITEDLRIDDEAINRAVSPKKAPLTETQASYKSLELELQKLGKGELVDTLRNDVQGHDELSQEAKARVYEKGLRMALEMAKKPIHQPGELVMETPRKAGFDKVQTAAKEEPLDHGTIYQVYLKAKNEGIEHVNRDMLERVRVQTGAKSLGDLRRWVENNWPKDVETPTKTIPIAKEPIPAVVAPKPPMPTVRIEPPSEGLISMFMRKGYSREEAIQKATDYKLGRASGDIQKPAKPVAEAKSAKAPKGVPQAGFDMIKEAVVARGGPALARFQLMKEALEGYREGIAKGDPTALKKALDHVRTGQLPEEEPGWEGMDESQARPLPKGDIRQELADEALRKETEQNASDTVRALFRHHEDVASNLQNLTPDKIDRAAELVKLKDENLRQLTKVTDETIAKLREKGVYTLDQHRTLLQLERAQSFTKLNLEDPKATTLIKTLREYAPDQLASLINSFTSLGQIKLELKDLQGFTPSDIKYDENYEWMKQPPSEPLVDTFRDRQQAQDARNFRERNQTDAATRGGGYTDMEIPVKAVSPKDAGRLATLTSHRQQLAQSLGRLLNEGAKLVDGTDVAVLYRTLNKMDYSDPALPEVMAKLHKADPELAMKITDTIETVSAIDHAMKDLEGSQAQDYYNKPGSPKFIRAVFSKLAAKLEPVFQASAIKYAEASVPKDLRAIGEALGYEFKGAPSTYDVAGRWEPNLKQIIIGGLKPLDQLRMRWLGTQSMAHVNAHEVGHLTWSFIRGKIGIQEHQRSFVRMLINEFPEPVKQIWQEYAKAGTPLSDASARSQDHEAFAETFAHWYMGELTNGEHFTKILTNELSKSGLSLDLQKQILALEGRGKLYQPPLLSIPFSFNDVLVAKMTGDESQGMPMSSPMDIAKSIVAPETPGEKEVAKGEVREYSGGLRRGRDILYKKYEAALKLYDKFTLDDFRDWTHIFQQEDWKNFTPQARQLAQSIQDGFKSRTAIIQNLTGDFLDYYKNYLPGMWENEKQAADYFERMVFGKRRLAGKAFFKQHKTYEFFDEALDAGLKPITNNPARLALIAMANMDKYIMAHRMVDEMKSEGLISFIKRGSQIPSGWERLDDPVFKPFFKVKDTSLTASAGEYFAHKDTARILNNYLSPGLRGNWAFDTLRKYSNKLNQFQLGWSGFHFTFTNMDAAISDLALGVEKVFKRGDMSGMGDALRSFVPFLSGHHAYKLGKMIEQEWDTPGTYPQLSAYTKALERAGFSAHQDPFYYNNGANAFRKALANKDYKSSPIKFVDAFTDAAVEFSSSWLMEKIVPRMKSGVAASLMANKLKEMELQGISDPHVIRMAMDRVVDSVDNRMGQMIYDNLFWPKISKDLGFLAIRSLGWNIGTFRELAGGASDWSNYVAGKATGRNRELTHRMAYVVAMPIVTGFYGAVVNYLYTGQAPQQKEDYFFPRTGEFGPDGKPERMSLPSYMKDVWSMSNHPGRTVIHKLHPAWSSIYEMMANEDFYGEEIRHKEDPLMQQALQLTKYAGKQIMPIGLRSGYQRLKGDPGLSVEKAFFSTELGLVPAPRYVGQSKAEETAFDFARRHMEQGPRTHEEAQRREELLRLRNQVAKNQLTGPAITKSLQTGRVGPKDIDKVRQERHLSPLERAFKQLSIEEAIVVWKDATPDERRKLMRLMQAKMANASEKPMLPEERLKLHQDFSSALREK